jgi:hypothetical protein
MAAAAMADLLAAADAHFQSEIRSMKEEEEEKEGICAAFVQRLCSICEAMTKKCFPSRSKSDRAASKIDTLCLNVS